MTEVLESTEVPVMRSVWRRALPQWSNSGAPAVAYSPSGQWIAVGAGHVDGAVSAGTLKVFDAATGQVHSETSSQWQVVEVAFSPDSQWLAVSEKRADNTIRVRVLAADLTPRCESEPEIHNNPVVTLVWGADGESLIAQTLPAPFEDPLAFAMDPDNGNEFWRVQPLPALTRLASSPDGALFAVGVNGIDVRKASDGTIFRQISISSNVWSVAYPHKDVVIAGCEDGFIRSFDVATGQPGWTTQSPLLGPILSLSASLDGRLIAGASGKLGVFDVADGKPRFPAITLDKLTWVRFNPTMRQVVSGWDCFLPPEAFPSTPPPPPRGLTVLNPRTGREELRSDPAVEDFAISPDGAFVAAKGKGFVEVYDLGITISRFDVGQTISAIKVSAADKPLVAVADKSAAVTVVPALGGNPLMFQTITGGIVDIDFADGGTSVVVARPTGVRLISIGVGGWTKNIGAVNAIAALGPTGQWIAAAVGKDLALLSSDTGDPRWPNYVHPKPVSHVAASHDGKWIATACTDKRTRIINAQTGTETYKTDPPSIELIQALAFQPNGSLLASGSNDGCVTLIDPEAMSPLRGQIKRNFGCTRLAFSSDATKLAVAWNDKSVIVYDITTNGDPAPLREFRFATPVTALAFNPADNTVTVSVGATSICRFDTQTGTPLAPVLHPKPAKDFAFSANGALIATACDDGAVRVFATGPPSDT